MTREEVLAIMTKAREGGPTPNLRFADLCNADLSDANLSNVLINKGTKPAVDLSTPGVLSESFAPLERARLDERQAVANEMARLVRKHYCTCGSPSCQFRNEALDSILSSIERLKSSC